MTIDCLENRIRNVTDSLEGFEHGLGGGREGALTRGLSGSLAELLEELLLALLELLLLILVQYLLHGISIRPSLLRRHLHQIQSIRTPIILLSINLNLTFFSLFNVGEQSYTLFVVVCIFFQFFFSN